MEIVSRYLIGTTIWTIVGLENIEGFFEYRIFRNGRHFDRMGESFETHGGACFIILNEYSEEI